MTVSSATSRVSYNGNGSTTVFAYTFKIFDQDDLTVIIRSANGTETVKTITTHYTVSGVGNAGGGNVTMLTAPASGETLVIIREQDLIQELDIVPNDPFPASSVEDALDKLTFMVQQHEETLGRTIKASRTNAISSTEFTVSAANRANKVFSFDANGDLSITQSIGSYRSAWASGTAYALRDIVKDSNDNLYICITAHTSSGSTPISTNADSAKWELLLDVAAFTTLYDQFDDRYLGAKSSDPSVDNDGNALIDGAFYWNTTDNRLKVYDLGNTAWSFTTPSPAEQANIDALAPISGDIATILAAYDANLAAFVSVFTLPTADGTADQALVTDGSGNLVFQDFVSLVKYDQLSKSEDYTLVLGDAGKQIFHPASDFNRRTFTIPANSSVAFPIGTVILFTAQKDSLPVTVSITSDTLVTNGGFTGDASVTDGNTLYCIKVTSTEWMGYFLRDDSRANGAEVIAFSSTATPFVHAYAWSGNGFGAKLANPSTLPTNGSQAISFSPKGDAIVVGETASPYVSAYTFSANGFGQKFPNPSTSVSASTNGTRDIAFSPAGDAVALAVFGGSYINAYAFDSSTGFGARFANPATLPTGNAYRVAFSPAGNAVAVAHATAPYVTAYPFNSSTGFGTKFANPATAVTGNAESVAFSPAGDAIVIGHSVGPNISAYAWSASGFGTKFSNPATSVGVVAADLLFSPSGDTLFGTFGGTPYVFAYAWSASGFGSRYSNPSTLPTGNGYALGFSEMTNSIAVAHDTAPYVSVYPWNSSSGFGTKYSNPVVAMTNTATGVEFTQV